MRIHIGEWLSAQESEGLSNRTGSIPRGSIISKKCYRCIGCPRLMQIASELRTRRIRMEVGPDLWEQYPDPPKC